jgi:hypothetical protein
MLSLLPEKCKITCAHLYSNGAFGTLYCNSLRVNIRNIFLIQRPHIPLLLHNSHILHLYNTFLNFDFPFMQSVIVCAIRQDGVLHNHDVFKSCDFLDTLTFSLTIVWFCSYSVVLNGFLKISYFQTMVEASQIVADGCYTS